MQRTQLRTILWLRWRLTRNQWSRGGQINAVITLLVTLVVTTIGILGGFAGLLAGIFGMTRVATSPTRILLFWDMLTLMFLFFWSIGLISEIQRSESIDMRRLMHLPIGLRQLFVLNYLASFACFSIVLLAPGMLGLGLGLTLGKRWHFIGLIPLVLSFLFMITAWTYCLRGWLVALMVNPRRRRAVIAGVTLGFILLCQLPNLVNLTAQNHRRQQRQAQQEKEKNTPVTEVNVAEANVPADPPAPRPRRPVPDWALTVHRVVPVLWIGYGARSLARGDIGPALWGTLGATLLGILGLRRAYYATLGFYLGRASGRRRRRVTPQRIPGRQRPLLVARSLPGLSDPTSALGLTFFRSNLRAPEIKMMLGTSFIMLFVFGGIFFARSRANLPVDLKSFGAAGAVVVTFFGLTQLMFNLFGSDRSGFRALVLCPCARRRILLGKNLSVLPYALLLGSALLILCLIFLRVGGLVFLCGLLQLGTAFLCLSMVGNLCSILMPYRIAPGSLKPTKPPALLIFLQILTHLCFPLIMFPVFLPPILGLLVDKAGWLPGPPVNLAASAVILCLAAFFYRRSLAPLGRLLQAREQRILAVVTQEVE
jgi:hypothetical protein